VALESAACKIFGTETLWMAVNDAVQCAGGNGFTTDYPYERILRDARVNMIFEGTNEILRLMIAGEGLKAPARRPALRAAAGRRAGPAARARAAARRGARADPGAADLEQTGAAALPRTGRRSRTASSSSRAGRPGHRALRAGRRAARAPSVVESKGEEGAAAELLLARGACRRRARAARDAVAALRDNEDGLLLETAALVRRAAGLPGDPT
jgi:acyl-CoA dehydrogenase family protein 9